MTTRSGRSSSVGGSGYARSTASTPTAASQQQQQSFQQQYSTTTNVSSNDYHDGGGGHAPPTTVGTHRRRPSNGSLGGGGGGGSGGSGSGGAGVPATYRPPPSQSPVRDAPTPRHVSHSTQAHILSYQSDDDVSSVGGSTGHYANYNDSVGSSSGGGSGMNNNMSTPSQQGSRRTSTSSSTSSTSSSSALPPRPGSASGIRRPSTPRIVAAMAAAADAHKNFNVVVRIRPPLPRELNGPRGPFAEAVLVSADGRAMSISESPLPLADRDTSTPPGSTLVNGVPPPAPQHRFTFDSIYDQDATQQAVYNTSARDAVVSVLQGYNATVLACMCICLRFMILAVTERSCLSISMII
jgi:hypothetical protein